MYQSDIFSIQGLLYGGGLKVLSSQLIGVMVCGITAITLAFITFWLIRFFVGLRVREQTEINGLDNIEHGISAYINL
ncbi:ammonium transporter [Vallitalea guaymasensis]|uniref:ammonium transporter n=1 Tax=Vallitalea guaymasensis TaxID=1185412 RepID=UPI000DE38999|nr:ammonium transporter [Vallitalea guaymasensis]